MRDRVPPFPPPDDWLIDETWADIGRQVPGGSGGFFIVDDQRVHYLVNPDREKEALAALSALGVTSPFTSREAAVRQGRWDIAQLCDWYTYVQMAVGWPPGLESANIDESRNRLPYSVSDMHAAESLAAAFEDASLPCELTVSQVGDGDLAPWATAAPTIIPGHLFRSRRKDWDSSPHKGAMATVSVVPPVRGRGLMADHGLPESGPRCLRGTGEGPREIRYPLEVADRPRRGLSSRPAGIWTRLRVVASRPVSELSTGLIATWAAPDRWSPVRGERATP